MHTDQKPPKIQSYSFQYSQIPCNFQREPKNQTYQGQSADSRVRSERQRHLNRKIGNSEVELNYPMQLRRMETKRSSECPRLRILKREPVIEQQSSTVPSNDPEVLDPPYSESSKISSCTLNFDMNIIFTLNLLRKILIKLKS